MNAKNRTLVVGVGAAALPPLFLGGLLGWPAWVTAPVFLAVVGAVFAKLNREQGAAEDAKDMIAKLEIRDSAVRVLLADRVAKLVDAAGNSEVAEDIRHGGDAAPSPRWFARDETRAC